MNSFSTRIENIDFVAVYPEKKFQRHNRFMLLSLTNPVSWVVGGLHLINELFKSAILYFVQTPLFGSTESRIGRKANLIKTLEEMNSKRLRLKSPDGRLLEAMYTTLAQTEKLDSTQQKTFLLFTGSHRSFEFDAYAIIIAYQKHGFNVLCINYGGFGTSEGSPNQSSIELDAETAYQYIKKTYPNNDIYAHGYSLGSYPATYLAKKYNLKKVVIDRGFSDLPNVVKDSINQSYGRVAGYVLQSLVNYVSPFNNLDNIKNSTSKFLCTRASDDRSMLKYHADLIYKQSPDNIAVIDFQGDHLQNSYSVWFQNDMNFWTWVNNPLP